MNNQGGNYGRAPAPGQNGNNIYPHSLRAVSRDTHLFCPGETPLCFARCYGLFLKRHMGEGHVVSKSSGLKYLNNFLIPDVYLFSS